MIAKYSIMVPNLLLFSKLIFISIQKMLTHCIYNMVLLGT